MLVNAVSDTFPADRTGDVARALTKPAATARAEHLGAPDVNGIGPLADSRVAYSCTPLPQ